MSNVIWPSETQPTRPHAFFRGDYCFRTLNGALAVLAPLLTSAVLAALAVLAWRNREDLLVRVVGVGFALVALVFGGLGLWTLWSWIRKRRIGVEIKVDGIVCGNRFWPWEHVPSFSGARYSNGVCLKFTPTRTIVWGDGSLPTTPLLTDEEYVQLASALSQVVSIRFPHVAVIREPVDAPVDP